MDKKSARLRRARRGRSRLRELRVMRLSVPRTPRHIYAQVIAAEGDRVLAAASTLDKDLRSGATGNIDAAARVGKLIAERAKAAGITSVAFDHVRQPRGDFVPRLVPGRRLQLAIAPNVRLIEPLGPQTVGDMPRLVGDPFLVHAIITLFD